MQELMNAIMGENGERLTAIKIGGAQLLAFVFSFSDPNDVLQFISFIIAIGYGARMWWKQEKKWRKEKK